MLQWQWHSVFQNGCKRDLIDSYSSQYWVFSDHLISTNWMGIKCFIVVDSFNPHFPDYENMKVDYLFIVLSLVSSSMQWHLLFLPITISQLYCRSPSNILDTNSLLTMCKKCQWVVSQFDVVIYFINKTHSINYEKNR